MDGRSQLTFVGALLKLVASNLSTESMQGSSIQAKKDV
jgi:hypothetical protein